MADSDHPMDEGTVREAVERSRSGAPTVGNPNCDLSAEVARSLRATTGAKITLLHVVDGPDEREAAERFLADWAVDHDIGEARLAVDDSKNVEEAIAREAADHSMVIIGATERGLLSRLVRDSLHLGIINQIDCSLLLAERATDRSIRERLFGRR